MKTLLLFLIIFVLAVSGRSQSPEFISYQAVARDTAGNILVEETVHFRLSILSDSVNGTSVYRETQDAVSGTYGLISIRIGKGTVISGIFQDIDWGNHTHFLQAEFCHGSDTVFHEMGVTQFLSVPYSLYAKKAGAGGDIYSAGTGIEVSNFVISNTQPDQPVAINSGTAIGVSGTYPEFTVSNLSPDVPVNLNNGPGIGIAGGYPAFTINNTAPDQPVNINPGDGILVDGGYPDFIITNANPDQVVNLNAGMGISVVSLYPSFWITNTKPDQTITLNAGTGISISGTYPAFNITNTQPNATHTGDATGGSALTVVKIQGRDVSSATPTSGQVLKWSGSAWVPNTDATRDGCPAGFTSVNAEYCIETTMHDWNLRTWFNAITACGDVSGGAHLCSWAEWYNACARAGTLGLSNMTGYWQWCDDAVSATNYARVAGSSACTSRDNKDVDGTNGYTRCCFYK